MSSNFICTIPARFGLIWFSGFRGEDLNVIFYQNMPNLHNRYKSAERKYMLNNSLIGIPIIENITHTAKHAVNAIVLAAKTDLACAV
jgi:hypothetical protein